MSDMKLSHNVLKVKISNVKDKLENTGNSQPPQTVKSHPPEPVLQYSLPTANRFELLSHEESDNQVHRTTGAEGSVTTPKQALNPSVGPTVTSPKDAPGKKRIVLIGDSNAQKLKPNLLCPNADMPRPYWSPNLFTTPTVLEKLAKEDNAPQTVILHVGTNDVMAKPKDTIISDFEMTVSTTQSLFPDTEIVVSAVPPRRDSSYRPHANADIAEINTHLQNLCSSNEQMTYVNHPQLWSNNDYCPNFYESDGYHLNGDGVRIIASNLKKQATSALGLPPRKHNRSPRRLSHKRPDNHVDSPPHTTREGMSTETRTTIVKATHQGITDPGGITDLPNLTSTTEHEGGPPGQDHTSRQAQGTTSHLECQTGRPTPPLRQGRRRCTPPLHRGRRRCTRTTTVRLRHHSGSKNGPPP
ncbi:hypothetical protein Bbelb_374630 [Branchiostoma belcheri]|nr:hypothetical protein Bbelb_374630 [Branchiostoma belcheri]